MGRFAGIEIPAQFVEALRAARGGESASADFHELRRGFFPAGSIMRKTA
jgi:hypothetical protein